MDSPSADLPVGDGVDLTEGFSSKEFEHVGSALQLLDGPEANAEAADDSQIEEHLPTDETAEQMFGFMRKLGDDAVSSGHSHDGLGQGTDNEDALPALGHDAKRQKYEVVDAAMEGKPHSVPILSTVLSHVVKDAIKLTDGNQFKYPWERGRLKRIFSGVSPLDAVSTRLQPSRNNFVSVQVQIGDKSSLTTSLHVAPSKPDGAIYLQSVHVMLGGSYMEDGEHQRADAVNLCGAAQVQSGCK